MNNTKRGGRKQRQPHPNGNVHAMEGPHAHQPMHAANALPMHLGAYSLPYNQYQHATRLAPGALPPGALNPASGHGPSQAQAMQHYGYPYSGQPTTTTTTPPSKRPRTDPRQMQRTEMVPFSSTPPYQKAQPLPRRSFSDFRIAQLTIGSWQTTTDPACPRDMRLRFYFRQAGDIEPEVGLSAAEQALVAPDRISISCNAGRHRIIIPAHHVKSVLYRRAEGVMLLETDGWAAFQTWSEEAGWQGTDGDLTKGQLAVSKKLRILLDTIRPLTEPKWARARGPGDAIEATSRFSKITRVEDVQPGEQFDQFLAGWAQGSAERETARAVLGRDIAALVALSATALVAHCNTLEETQPVKVLERLLGSLTRLATAPERTGTHATTEVLDACKTALLALSPARIASALEARYGGASLQTQNVTQVKQIEKEATATQEGEGNALGYGFKRQRGESEVPSDALARATLDEKRRRLSESERERPVVLTDALEREQASDEAKFIPIRRSNSTAMPIKSTETGEAEDEEMTRRRVRRSESADGRLTTRPGPPWSRGRYFDHPTVKAPSSASDQADDVLAIPDVATTETEAAEAEADADEEEGDDEDTETEAVPLSESMPSSPMRPRRRRHRSAEPVVLRRVSEEGVRLSREERLALMEAQEDDAAESTQDDEGASKRRKD